MTVTSKKGVRYRLVKEPAFSQTYILHTLLGRAVGTVYFQERFWCACATTAPYYRQGFKTRDKAVDNLLSLLDDQLEVV